MKKEILNLKLCGFISLLLCSSNAVGATIDAVFFAQTHVQQVNDTYSIGLVSNRQALIKAHVVSAQATASTVVTARLNLGADTLSIRLNGPSTLPQSIEKRPGRVRHSFANTFSGYIPKEWLKPGLKVSIITSKDRLDINNIRIGAPTEVLMTMFDVHFFEYSPGDYAANWQAELEAKWPVSKLSLTRVPKLVFKELVIPARAGAPAVKINSKQDYVAQTGLNFDGEQAAASQWNRALQRAAGTRGRTNLYYSNIYGVAAGGQAGGFAGVGNGTKTGILHHELGHALSLPHWGNNASYPYKGDMLGISAPNTFKATHVGPTWAFDLRLRRFIPPTVQSNSVSNNARIGVFKAEPMQGGGQGDQEKGFILRHFSDYSVRQIRDYLERHVVVWNKSINSYAVWNQGAGAYSNKITNNGVFYPTERNTSVISVMASISASSPNVNMIYDPIGPYQANLIDLFDPTDVTQRQQADDVFCPNEGCDLSLRVVQGGKRKTLMLAASWNPSLSPTDSKALSTQAVNLKASDGKVSYVELLLTPDAEKNGLPQKPIVLAKWGRKTNITPIYLIDLLDET